MLIETSIRFLYKCKKREGKGKEKKRNTELFPFLSFHIDSVIQISSLFGKYIMIYLYITQEVLNLIFKVKVRK